MIKLNSKYKKIFSNKYRYNLISGGRGSGKSYAVALYLLALTFEKGNVILFSRYTMSSVAISVFPEFIDKIETLNLNHLFEITKNEIINVETGSKIIFKGIRTGSSIQTANLKSIANLNIVCIDEAEELVSEEIFDKIDYSARRVDKQNKIILVFNPMSKAHWIYERFFEQQGVEPGQCTTRDDINYIHTTYLDNKKNLSPSIIKQIERIRETNYTKYKHIIMGGFLDVAEGVIFTNWSIGEYPDIDSLYGMDFGFSEDPTTLIKVGIDKREMKIYLHEELYITKKEDNITPRLYQQMVGVVGKDEIIGDNSEGRLIEELKRKGLNIKQCVKGAGSVKEGIKLMQDYELIISPTSTNLIKELNNYVWNDRRSETPIDMYNHCIDAARYAISNRLKVAPIKRYALSGIRR
jgi:phage terminase large subunit